MKHLAHSAIFALCSLSLSCTTSPPDHQMVSDAWLDTTPRKAEYPPRSANGITHWNAGLPPARTHHDSPSNQAGSPVSSAKTAREISGAADDSSWGSYRVSSSYPVLYQSHQKHYRHHRCRRHHDRSRPQRQSYQRTVEKVGPSIVPQAKVPLTDRSRADSGLRSYYDSRTTYR